MKILNKLNHLKRKLFKICFFTILVLFLSGFLNVYSQENVPVDTVLIFVHKVKEKQKFIKQDKRITYWLNDENGKQKGKLNEIRDTVLIINDKIIPYSQFKKIGAKSTGLKVVQVTGKILLISGTLVSSYGAYLIIYGYSIADTDGCGGALSIIIGVIVASVGIPVMIIGAIPLAIVGKRFDLEKKWDMHLQTVPDNKQIRKMNRNLKKSNQ